MKISLLFTPTPITPLIGVEPVQLWGQRDCPSPKATLNGQSLLQFAPLSNKNFAKTGVGVNCNCFPGFHKNTAEIKYAPVKGRNYLRGTTQIPALYRLSFYT